MDGHRGTGGGGGQEQGGIVAELQSQLPNVMYACRLGPCPVTGARGGVCMYVCMYAIRRAADGQRGMGGVGEIRGEGYVCMYVHTVVDGMACICSIYLYDPASLTLSLAVMSAPCCRRSEQIAVWR